MDRKIPPVDEISREVAVYDPRDQSWKRGRRRDPFVPQDVEKITWTATGVNTDVKPDRDKEIDTLYAQRIVIQIDTRHTSNTSSDFDVNVMASVDGSTWDTVPYAERNIGDAEVKTFVITPCPAKIRLRGDNNASATTGYVTALVLVID